MAFIELMKFTKLLEDTKRRFAKYCNPCQEEVGHYTKLLHVNRQHIVFSTILNAKFASLPFIWCLLEISIEMYGFILFLVQLPIMFTFLWGFFFLPSFPCSLLNCKFCAKKKLRYFELQFMKIVASLSLCFIFNFF